jgi:DNA-binding NtrC family response regulator
MITAKKKVLVVDDERSIRQLLADFLSNRGFEVSIAKNGQESLDQLETNTFDLVITEIDLSRVDGVQMLKQMEKARRKERVIVMTADPTDHRLLKIQTPHVVSRLNKPFRMDNFLDTVIAATSNGETPSIGKDGNRIMEGLA